MRRGWVVVALAGCGRLQFDEVPRPDAMIEPAPECPAGFVGVRGSPVLATDDFCLMQTEARAWADANGDTIVDVAELDVDGCSTPACDADWPSGTHLPVSLLPVPANPWRSVSQIVAQLACRSLGDGYDLLANREWMTIARDAELVAANWASGVVGVGRIAEGNTDTVHASTIDDASDPYTGTGNDASQLPDLGWEQRRTLLLADGTVLWDMPGNVQEWVDWTIGGPLDGAPLCASSELPTLACAGYELADFQSSTGTYDSTYGVGYVIGSGGDAVRRGGQGTDRSMNLAGIYAFNTNRDPPNVFAGTGFRCVYRLPSP